MTKQEYIAAQVEKLVAKGVEREAAQMIANLSWNFIKWQYE